MSGLWTTAHRLALKDPKGIFPDGRLSLDYITDGNFESSTDNPLSLFAIL